MRSVIKLRELIVDLQCKTKPDTLMDVSNYTRKDGARNTHIPSTCTRKFKTLENPGAEYEIEIGIMCYIRADN